MSSFDTNRPANVHPMVTRAKNGIDQPRIHPTLLLARAEPKYVKQALQGPKWVTTMTDEFNALQISYTCTLVPLPQNRIAIRCKWVFRVKENSDGSVNKYKDRLVAKGFNQQFGFDFHETFSRYQTCHYKGHSHSCSQLQVASIITGCK